MGLKTTKNQRIAMSAYLYSTPENMSYTEVLTCIEDNPLHDELTLCIGCQDWDSQYLIECIEALKDTLERAYKLN